MKRLLLLLLLILIGLMAVVVGRTLLLPAAAYNSAPVSLPEGLDGQRAAESLAAAIRLPTLSHQVGAPASQLAASDAAFAELREWLAQRYPRVTAGTESLATGSPSILLRWPGKDAQLPAALLMAHQDVVPVAPGTEALWTHPPFSGAIAEGFVWGRGAIDSKGSMVAILEAVETLIAQGFQPQRDVLLAFGHDEEIGGHQGNRRIAAQLQEQGKRLAWVSDEGGFVVRGQIPGVSQDVAVVGIAEKGYLSLTLTASAQGGHSSQPPAFDETAVGRLSQALPVLNAVFAGSGDQHLDVTLTAGRRADLLEVEINLVEREGDVLVGLGFDRELHLGLAQAFGEDDLLGDDRGRRQRHRHVLHPAAKAPQRAFDRLADGFEVGDVAVDDRIPRQLLDRVTLHFVSVLVTPRQLDQLDG